MKKNLCLCLLAILLSTFSIDAKPITLEPLKFNAAGLVDTAVNQQATLKLLFSDEFSTAYVNTTKWITQLQWGRTNGNELQYYASNSFWYKYGIGRLVAQKKPIFDKEYTSGALATYGRFKFTYGIVRIRARIPSGRGLWPALWLLDYAGGAEEIDIAEWIGHQPNITYMTLHYPTEWSGNKSLGSHYTGPNFSLAYHVYTVDWNKSAITWYIDGIKRYQLTEHVPTKPMYLIMNLAVGGDWAGPPSEFTQFPALFNIDYVRIYQYQ